MAYGFHATSSLTPQEGEETRQYVDAVLPRPQHCRKEKEQGGMWTPHHLAFDTAGKGRNEAACGLHTALSSTLLEGGEMRQRVDSTLPCLQCCGKEEKRGSIWFPCCLVSDVTERRETRQCVISMPSRCQCCRKDGK